MINFSYCNPVRLVFGKGSIAQLPGLLPVRDGIMMIYGGGSIKRNGVYDQVVAALKDLEFAEFPGIEPNPRYETCMKAVEIARKNRIRFLLAVGGGSVIDATKFIAAAVGYKGGDPWDIVAKAAPLESALPLGTILTLPATGSEMNPTAVISRASTGDKLPFSDPCVYPVFSILDPETTYSLPERQLVNGVVDAFVHVTEQYILSGPGLALQDRFCESILAVVLEEAPRILMDSSNYEARANIMWCATNALNGWCGLGRMQDWATHMIGHELTALYGIDHAQSLAVVLPELWRAAIRTKERALAQLARRVFGAGEKSDSRAAEIAVEKTEEFFHSMGMKTRLADYGINSEEAAEKVYERFMGYGDVAFGEDGDVNAARAREILLRC